MTVARHTVVDESSEGVYHCMARCVRRAFLCGEDHYSGQNFDHRKAWVRNRLKVLTKAFGLDVYAYAVMSNHLHVVVRNRPDDARGWSAQEVARRWPNPDIASVFPLGGPVFRLASSEPSISSRRIYGYACEEIVISSSPDEKQTSPRNSVLVQEQTRFADSLVDSDILPHLSKRPMQ